FVVGPASLTAGSRAVVDLGQVGAGESVWVVPVLGKQEDTATDGIQFTLETSGLQTPATLASTPKISQRERLHENHVRRLKELRGRMAAVGRADPGHPAGPGPVPGFGKCKGPYVVGGTECTFQIIPADS